MRDAPGEVAPTTHDPRPTTAFLPPSKRGDAVRAAPSVYRRRAPAATGQLLPLEDGLPLLDVGGDAFLRVLALEEQGLELALDGEAVLERDLRAGLHRPLDVADRHRRHVRRRELGRVLDDLRHERI